MALEASLAKRLGGARLDSEAIKALLMATTRAVRPVMMPAAVVAAAIGLGAIAEAAALGAEPAATSPEVVAMAAGVWGASVAATGLSVPVGSPGGVADGASARRRVGGSSTSPTGSSTGSSASADRLE